VTDVEPVNRLHQAADGLLQEVGVAQGVVPEPLGDVGRQPDVRGRQAVFAVDVAVVDPADVNVRAHFGVAIIADELGHGPRFERRAVGAQTGKMTDQQSDQLAFVFPEQGQQCALFFGRQQVRGKDRGRGVQRDGFLGRLAGGALTALRLHCYLPNKMLMRIPKLPQWEARCRQPRPRGRQPTAHATRR
jgi:hypothetical protein